MLFGTKCWGMEIEHQRKYMEMCMLRGLHGVRRKDRTRNEDTRETTVMSQRIGLI